MSAFRYFLIVFFLTFPVLTKADGTHSNPMAMQGHLFTIQGSYTIGATLAPELVKRWMESHGLHKVSILETAIINEQRVVGVHPQSGNQVTVEVKAHGSSSGFNAMLAREADIAASSRRIKPIEKAKLAKFGDMQTASSEQVVGIDGIAVIVNSKNPLNRLSTDDVARIFSGEITNWKALGGRDSAITIYARNDQSGTWDTFRSLVLGKTHQLSASARRFESNTVLSDRVADDTAAIGFVSINTIGRAKPLAIAAGQSRALLPERLVVATEDYALSRRLYFYLPAISTNTHAKRFLNWVATAPGQTVVDSVGYICQSVKPYLVNIQDTPKDFQTLVGSSQRLSVNFRFENGKAKLDNKATKDIQRLAEFMSTKPGKIKLIGFSEKDGGSMANLLSELRAKVVRSALIRAGVSKDRLEPHGYGKYMHLAEGDNPSADIKNRRVEVWYQPTT